MGKNDHAKVVLPSLQADGGNVADIFFRHHLAELLKARARKGRQRFGHLGEVVKGHKSAPPVGQFGDVFSGPALFHLADQLRRESALHRGQNGAPAFGNIDHRPARRQRRHQPVQDVLQAGHQIFRRKQPHRIHAQSRKCQRILLHRIALVLEQHHHHRDAQQHLRNRAQEMSCNSEHGQERSCGVPPKTISTAHSASEIARNENASEFLRCA